MRTLGIKADLWVFRAYAYGCSVRMLGFVVTAKADREPLNSDQRLLWIPVHVSLMFFVLAACRFLVGGAAHDPTLGTCALVEFVWVPSSDP